MFSVNVVDRISVEQLIQARGAMGTVNVEAQVTRFDELSLLLFQKYRTTANMPHSLVVPIEMIRSCARLQKIASRPPFPRWSKDVVFIENGSTFIKTESRLRNTHSDRPWRIWPPWSLPVAGPWLPWEVPDWHSDLVALVPWVRRGLDDTPRSRSRSRIMYLNTSSRPPPFVSGLVRELPYMKCCLSPAPHST